MAVEEPTKRTDLSDLVRTRMEENGQSLRTLAGACIDPEQPDAGPQWTRGTLDNLTRALTKAPTRAQLRALAAGLNLPRLAVRRAAAAQYFEMTEHWSEIRGTRTRVLIANIEELDEEDVQEVAELADVVIRRRARRSSGQG